MVNIIIAEPSVYYGRCTESTVPTVPMTSSNDHRTVVPSSTMATESDSTTNSFTEYLDSVTHSYQVQGQDSLSIKELAGDYYCNWN